MVLFAKGAFWLTSAWRHGVAVPGSRQWTQLYTARAERPVHEPPPRSHHAACVVGRHMVVHGGWVLAGSEPVLPVGAVAAAGKNNDNDEEDEEEEGEDDVGGKSAGTGASAAVAANDGDATIGPTWACSAGLYLWDLGMSPWAPRVAGLRHCHCLNLARVQTRARGLSHSARCRCGFQASVLVLASQRSAPCPQTRTHIRTERAEAVAWVAMGRWATWRC
jgi:hypothetical protein